MLITLLLASPMLFVGLRWGLPSRAADPYLFGDHPVWSGQKLFDLAGGWPDAPDIGADVARHPLADRSKPLTLNGDDASRARILVRYRLYSYQPDELITFRALSHMKPGHAAGGGVRLGMDPALYQYGGLWIYPVGGLLRLGGALKLVTLRSDVAFYLDHPEAFGRFYFIARAYSALWGLLGVGVVFVLVRRICEGRIAPAVVAGLLFALLPVVVNAAHEAKPHLAGAVLILFAVLAAAVYVERGTSRCAIIAGALCGAATGMVLSAVVALTLLPVMILLRRATFAERWRHLLKATLAMAIVYVVTNPYVLINLVSNHALLRSNLGNSAAMYQAGASSSAAWNAARLIMEGASPLLAMIGVSGALMLGGKAIHDRKLATVQAMRRRATGLLLATPAVFVAIQFVCFAAGKPGEYGRFALLLDVALLIEAVVAVHTFVVNPALRGLFPGLLVLSTGFFGLGYLRGFINDSAIQSPRLQWAAKIDSHRRSGLHVLAIGAEPAPYSLPPVSVFDWNIVLLPRGGGTSPLTNVADSSIRAVDFCPDAPILTQWTATSMSWAGKWFVFTDQSGRRECGR